MTDVTMHAGLLFEALEKSFANLQVNLEWAPYIFPFHSVELQKDTLCEETIATLECVMYLRDGDSYAVSRTIDKVLTPEQLHEWIGTSVKGAINYLIAWGRRQEG